VNLQTTKNRKPTRPQCGIQAVTQHAGDHTTMIKTKSEDSPYKIRFTNGRDMGFADNTKGKGGNDNGFRPHELLEAALATCMNMTLRMRAEKLSIAPTDFSTTVSLDRSNPDETIFECSVEFAESVPEADRRLLSEAARSCSVRQTLSKRLTFKD
jgi:putative redox protein